MGLCSGVVVAQHNTVGFSVEDLPGFDCIIEPSDVVDVGSAVPGVIEKVHVDIGDFVDEGMPVSRLDLSVELANLELAKAKAASEASIELHKQEAAFSKRAKTRSQELYKKSLIALQEIDRLETEQRIAELKVKKAFDEKHIAELDFERTREQIKRRTIRSPLRGVVVERYKSAGEYVEDVPVMRLARLDPLHVEIIVPVEYMGRIAIGSQAEVTPSVPSVDKQYATVDRIDKVADTASGTFGIRLNLPNPDYAVPGGLRCQLAFLAADFVANSDDSNNSQRGDTLANYRLASKVTTAGSEYSAFPPNISAAPEQRLVSTETDQSNCDLQGKLQIMNDDEDSLVSLLTKMPSNTIIRTPQFVNVPLRQMMVDKLDSIQSVDRSNLNIPKDVSADNSPLTQNNQCYVVGPINNESTAKTLSEQIRVYTKDTHLTEKSHESVKDYLVFTRPQANFKSASRLVARLRRSGVKDMQILGSKSLYPNRVALGIFKVKANATNRKKRLRALGVEIDILARKELERRFWLELTVSDDKETIDKIGQFTKDAVSNYTLKSKVCNALLAHQLIED
jgi:RND family efflux transporter MFP subunit